MATNHYKEGKVMTWTNDTGSDVAANEAVLVGDLLGVALGDIADEATGELAIEEVWELPKQASLAIDQGAQVYWDDTAGEVDTTDTNAPCGKAFVAALAAASTVYVKLNA